MVARSLIKRDGVPRSPSPARLQRFGPVAYRLMSRRGDTTSVRFYAIPTVTPTATSSSISAEKKEDGKFRASLRDSSLRRTREMAPNFNASGRRKKSSVSSLPVPFSSTPLCPLAAPRPDARREARDEQLTRLCWEECPPSGASILRQANFPQA